MFYVNWSTHMTTLLRENINNFSKVDYKIKYVIMGILISYTVDVRKQT